MFSKIGISRWLIVVAVLAVAECAVMTAIEVAFTAPAQAQFFGEQQYQYKRAQPRSGGFFQNFFSPFNSRPIEREYPPPQQEYQQRHTEQPSESSRAPAPRKTESKGKQVAPTTSIVVMGDGMADWLAYGLEDAFSDAPEIGIVRENKPYSGLLRYEAKSDLDWWHVARDILAKQNADYVVMMLGLSDRENIRQKDLTKETETKAKDQADKNEAQKKSEQTPAQTDNADDVVAPEPQRSNNRANGDVAFRSDEWVKIYSRRIDATIAALKSKGVPVFWVGLPSIRGTKSTADAVYLNDLYRARAERAGIVYIDLWDGFVDEAGKYSNYGPDYEGQTRRLRSSDGVFFTKYGARKLAHYVERELRRYMSNRVPVALPLGPVGPMPSEGKPAERPLAGPVVSLTGTPGNSDELLGGTGGSSAHADAIATKVLVKGEPVAAPTGRADDFVWPPGSDVKTAQPVAAAPPAAAQAKAVPLAAAGALASVPAIKAQPEPPALAEKRKKERKSDSAGKTTHTTVAKPKLPEETRPKSERDDIPRPPRPIGPSGGPFGWVR